MHIGHRLRKARKDSGMSQKAVGESLGITDVTYSRYELNKRTPGFDILEKLSKLYNVDITYFFEREVDDKRNELVDKIKVYLVEKQKLYDEISGFSHYFINSPNEDIDEIVNDLKKDYYALKVEYHELIDEMRMFDIEKLTTKKREK